mmetsp:Transcript_58067/g.170441  ORF Transcript_58067/g.170441 Transcript_58067/m.170441 type:complete len:256 (+) Transcript_58067:831-1598(+)
MRLFAAIATPLFLNLRKPARSPSSSSSRTFTARLQISRMAFRPTSITSGACASFTKLRMTWSTTGRSSSGGTSEWDASTRHASTFVTSCCVGERYFRMKGYMLSSRSWWRETSLAARCRMSSRKRKGSPPLETRCSSLSDSVCGSCSMSMATKLTCPFMSSLCFLFAPFFFTAFLAFWRRFAFLPDFLEPWMCLRASFSSSSSSSSSLSSRMPSRPLVLLPRKRCVSAAAILVSGWTRPALIRLTTPASLQTFCR